jgi:sarcosine oxidase, subunit alpha
MSFEFLSVDQPDAGRDVPAARSPLERQLRAAGARFEERDGWWVATDFGDVERELEAGRARVGVADRSSLAKLELQGAAGVVAEIVAEAGDGAEPTPGAAVSGAGAWWCALTPERVLVLSPPAAAAALRERLEAAAARSFATLVDVTAGLAALAVTGPSARELLARLTAIDTRPAKLPERGVRPGSVARVPATLLRVRGDRFLVLFGSYHAQYMWTAIVDAGERFGVAPVGSEALERLDGEGVARPEAPVAAVEAGRRA